jgi:hypothetical protein
MADSPNLGARDGNSGNQPGEAQLGRGPHQPSQQAIRLLSVVCWVDDCPIMPRAKVSIQRSRQMSGGRYREACTHIYLEAQ